MTQSVNIDGANRLVIRMPNWLGDAVMSLGMVEDLKLHYPSISIHALAQRHVAQLLEQHPAFSEIHTFEKSRRIIRNPIVELLRKHAYDIGLLTTRSLSSALWLYAARIPQRIGFAVPIQSMLLTSVVAQPEDEETEHASTTYKRLLAPLGIGLSDTPPRLYLTNEEENIAKSFISSMGCTPNMTVIGVNPCAAYGSAKCWPIEHFETTIYMLLKEPTVFVLFFGDDAAVPIGQKISKKLRSPRFCDCTGQTTIRTLMALIKQCRVLLTNDSGPMHIADALEVPVCALFGSTNELKTGPFRKNGVVIHKHVPCSPCYSRECPIDLRCFHAIHVDEVYQALQHILAR